MQVPWSTAAADGGTASSNPSSLWALGLGFLGQNREEEVGVKRGVVGGGGVQHEGRIEEGLVRQFSAMKAINGRKKVE